jgi:preprotein translocase SecE subunit
MSVKNNPVSNYIRKAYQELEKVTWLTRKQMVKSSLIVISVSIVITAFIALIDYLFSSGYIYLIDNLSN